MAIRTVSVSIGRTVSRNYNSTRVEVGLTADLPEGASSLTDADELRQVLAVHCERMVREEFARLKNGKPAIPEP